MLLSSVDVSVSFWLRRRSRGDTGGLSIGLRDAIVCLFDKSLWSSMRLMLPESSFETKVGNDLGEVARISLRPAAEDDDNNELIVESNRLPGLFGFSVWHLESLDICVKNPFSV